MVVGTVMSIAIRLVARETVVRHFYHRSHLDQVLLTFGLIYIFEELRSMLWGDDVHSVAVPAVLDWSIKLTDTLSYPAYRLFMLAICSALALGLWLLISKTKIGMKIRAGAFNSDMAQALGINIVRLHALVFAMGVALAALERHVDRPLVQRLPHMGSQVLIMCFVVVVIGGIGSVRGCTHRRLVGGLG